MKIQVLILAILALISSCTVVKKVHQPGYHVSWNKQYKSLNKNSEHITADHVHEPVMIAERALIEENTVAMSSMQEPIESVAEVLLPSNAVIAPIVEAPKKPTTQLVQNNNIKKAVQSLEKSKIKKTTDTSESSGEGKSQVVALILAILLGGIGIHRFYLGHIGMGVLYLLTAGLCGIGWLIDIIMIATGSLEPKDGSYDKTL